MSNPTRQTPKVGTLEKLGFATFSTASNVYFNFKDLFYLFFLTNKQNASCHAVDENVTISALAEGVRFYKRLLKEYDLYDWVRYKTRTDL